MYTLVVVMLFKIEFCTIEEYELDISVNGRPCSTASTQVATEHGYIVAFSPARRVGSKHWPWKTCKLLYLKCQRGLILYKKGQFSVLIKIV